MSPALQVDSLLLSPLGSPGEGVGAHSHKATEKDARSHAVVGSTRSDLSPCFLDKGRAYVRNSISV